MTDSLAAILILLILCLSLDQIAHELKERHRKRRARKK